MAAVGAIGTVIGITADELALKQACLGSTSNSATAEYEDLPQLPSPPPTPSSGYDRVHVETDKLLHVIDDVGYNRAMEPHAPASYIIFNEGPTVKARNGSTGAIDYLGSEPAAVIFNAINALSNGGKIFIKAGTYVLNSLPVMLGGDAGNAAIGSTSISGIELCGEGTASHLQLGTNQNGTVIGILNVNNWYIHDLQVDGNREFQSGWGMHPELMGMNLYNTTNTVVQNCYVHDCKTYGIQVYGNACRVLGNYVANSNANGIILYGCTGTIVKGNVVNGASDVGLDVSGGQPKPTIDILCEGNVVTNVNLGVSPWSLNTGIGMMVGDNGPASQVTVKDNIVDTCSGWGIYSGPGSGGTNYDLIFEGNQVYNCKGGISGGSTTRWTIKGNTIDTTSANNDLGDGVNIASSVVNGTVEGNTTYNTGYAGIFTGASGVKIIGNTVVMTSSPPDYVYAINVEADNCMIANNEVDLTGAKATIGAIYTGNSYGTISGNRCLGNATSLQTLGLLMYGDHNVVIGNSFRNFAGAWSFADNGVDNYISGNHGFNPLNQIKDTINTSNNTIGTNGTGGASPVASTDYTAQGPNLIVNVTGGTGASITVKDGAGNMILSALGTPLLGQRLPFGYKINFGAFSAAPTVTVFGE